MIEEILYIHPIEDLVFKDMKNCAYFDEEIMHYYKNFDEKLRKPDLLGKTVQVTERQFKEVYHIAQNVAGILKIELPSIYVYEDFYYGIETKGAENPWIEISAKTLADFEEQELLFLISREMCSIRLKHFYYHTLIDESLSALVQHHVLPGSDTLMKTLKVSMYRWSRIANYTEDCFGYVICKNLKPCISAILKLVLNNCYLAENVDIQEYIKQAECINRMDDAVYNFTKMDEKVPYGPFRIKNLISYASSTRGVEALKTT
ncbi:hypothetical protein Ccar_17780 [Clostridium carboxidivorans P7]|uniref:Uncharacterized protein n=1 Tax=Clostridium carboxidivorans P7 TaxID=536227 RepID=C6PSE5_9CLOT|nr:M48 family metallopeptidase [Clostridium carboxidivorans]AKN32596.1 hypothetical protein Ccar_17780 [Clostridium carboxidivorans P7]EET87823.1 conserved hypothetical protein [Clostridium carboxidivorans P7]EFG90196.1 hypothetical protein CLCAR_0402 [Clostridium carboxidivorans P7]